MKKTILTMVSTAAILASCSTEVNELDRKVDELYNRMSQEERIAQLRSGYINQLIDSTTGHIDPEKCKAMIPNGIGHFSQFMSQGTTDPNVLRDQVAEIQDWLMHNTPSGIPALCHEECLTGVNTAYATIYPQQIGQAGSFNIELAELKTRQTGTDMRKIGGVLSLSPMVDVCRNPSFNRLEESYGEDAYLSAAFGAAFTRGLQNGDLKQGVGTCSKHYLGYGGGGDAEEREMMEEIILPHEVMIRQEGSQVVMPGYHDIHGTRCVCNNEVLQEILRGYIGFEGMIVSDYTAIDQIPTETDALHKAAAAINNGNDVDFPYGANYQYLQEGLDQGLVKPEAFERAVKKVLRHKFLAGLFDEKPYLYSTENIVLDTPEERQTARDIASQSIVLLQNNGILPLTSHPSPINPHPSTIAHRPSTKKILLTGPNANSMWAMCGDYSFPAMSYFWKMAHEMDGEKPHVVRMLEGMNDLLPAGFSIKYSRGCDWTEEIETKYAIGGDERAYDYMVQHRKVDSGEKADEKEALRLAKDCDVIVAAMGENVMLCGENRDRQHLRLPGKQEEYIEKLLATGKPVVLVMYGGRAQVISKIADRCAAIIQAWYPGEEGGHAIADILYGNVNPSAKLSVSYPNQEVYAPLCYTYSEEQDTRVQWPFGYGLSYTTFEYDDVVIPTSAQTTDDAIEVKFNIRNTGSVAGTEVAQIYITNDKHPMLLEGFARVDLQPGEVKTVTTKLYLDQIGYFSNEGGKRQWNIEPGKTVIKIAASSQDVKAAETLTLEGKAVAKPLRNHYFSETIVE